MLSINIIEFIHLFSRLLCIISSPRLKADRKFYQRKKTGKIKKVVTKLDNDDGCRSLTDEKMRIARLDLVFLIIFPCLFGIFNVIYWASFLYIIPDINKTES